MSEYEREARRARLDALRRVGIDPYPARVGPHERIRRILERHASAPAEDLEREPVRVAVCGRILARRSFGKLVFLDLREDGDRIQVSARRGRLPEETFAAVRELDIADFVRVEGTLWRTRTGELTVDLEDFQLLAKALRPLPEKWHGLTDVEARFRQRYLDLLVNERARRTALIRAAALAAMREFLLGREFLEVETPILQPLYGGAAARPFVTHHNALDQDLYLRISDELYLKRLVVGGLDRVFEIGRNFRNEGIDRTHNPEFTMMECYQAFADYGDMLELCEAMVKHIATRALGDTRIEYQGQAIDLGGSYPRIRMRDAIRDATGVDILAHGEHAELARAFAGAGVEVGEAPTWGKLVDEVMKQVVEPKLVQPTFILDYPVELSPLAKRSSEDPRLVERFELFIAGMEIANAFSELNDPDDQRARFEEQRRAAARGDDEAHPLDEDYIRALEHGLPPTGGLGVGVDRLVMLLADAPHLREVILFPHLRPERE